jgi:hypothetical protein
MRCSLLNNTKDSDVDRAEVIFPSRRSGKSQEVDQELVRALQQMLDRDESITAWAVTRRMGTLGHASGLTRDAWRKERIEHAQRQQLTIRTSTEHPRPVSIVADMPQRATKLLDIKMIESFMEAARLGTMGGAARTLKIGEQSITQHVKQVEHWAGVQLLVRHGRGVTLTVAGSQFLARAEAAIRLLKFSPDKTPNARTVANKVTVAFPFGAGSTLALTALTEFHARHPHVMVEVREGSGANVEEWLINRQIDLAILEDPSDIPGTEMDLLFVQALGLVAKPAAADSRRSTPTHAARSSRSAAYTFGSKTLYRM